MDYSLLAADLFRKASAGPVVRLIVSSSSVVHPSAAARCRALSAVVLLFRPLGMPQIGLDQPFCYHSREFSRISAFAIERAIKRSAVNFQPIGNLLHSEIRILH